MTGRGLPSIVFSDMDATFLTDTKRIPQRNLDALALLSERGVEFVPCTGRSWTGIPPELLHHPAVHYVIGANGAIVVDLRTCAPLHELPIGRDRTLALFERVRTRACTFDIFCGGQVYTSRERFRQIEGFGIDPSNLALLKRIRMQLGLPTEQVIEAHPTVDKVTMYFAGSQDRRALIAAAEADPTLGWTTSHPKNVEVQDAAATKGTALAWLCGHLGISVADSVAFGDSLNDVPMLVIAGDGVAMRNATHDARAAADHMTALDNNSAGVGAYLFGML